jgi:hypothetical protein
MTTLKLPTPTTGAPKSGLVQFGDRPAAKTGLVSLRCRFHAAGKR